VGVLEPLKEAGNAGSVLNRAEERSERMIGGPSRVLETHFAWRGLDAGVEGIRSAESERPGSL